MATFTIATGADDGSRSQATSFNSNATYATVGRSGGSTYHGFLNYNNVTIPVGATITSAVIASKRQTLLPQQQCL
jgi:hypothetical protein